MKKKVLLFILTLSIFLETNAQCAMCRAVLESEEGQKTAEGVNNGIIYLMLIPYLLVGAFGFFWYRKLKSKN